MSTMEALRIKAHTLSVILDDIADKAPRLADEVKQAQQAAQAFINIAVELPPQAIDGGQDA